MAPRVRLLLVEDDLQLLDTLPGLLHHAAPQLSVVECCSTAADALAASARGLEFEVALVDLSLPDLDGATLIAQLAQARPEVTFIAWTKLDTPGVVFSALEAGASGYLLKTTAPGRLARAIEEVLEGGAPMSPSIARLVVDSFGARPAPPSRRLTSREEEVLKLLAGGAAYAEVARKLDIALGTVQTHVKNIYRKLKVSTRAGARRFARQAGLTGTDE